MALFNEILAGRYNRFLQKFLSMKGDPPAPQLAGEIAATWSMFHGVENRYLEAWDRFGVLVGQAAVAAQTAGIRFRNPPNSGVVAVLESVMIANANGAGDFYNIRDGGASADLTTVVAITNASLDPRARQAPSCFLSRQNNPPLTINPISGVQLATLTTFQFIAYENQELPILPGQGFQIDDNTVNQAVNVGFIWRERSLEDSEKT